MIVTALEILRMVTGFSGLLVLVLMPVAFYGSDAIPLWLCFAMQLLYLVLAILRWAFGGPAEEPRPQTR